MGAILKKIAILKESTLTWQRFHYGSCLCIGLFEPRAPFLKVIKKHVCYLPNKMVTVKEDVIT